MSRPADFTLVVGVDENLSFDAFKEGLQNVIDKVNKTPPKIRIDLDEAYISSQIKDIKTQFGELAASANNSLTSISDTRAKQMTALRSVLSKSGIGFTGDGVTSYQTSSARLFELIGEYATKAEAEILGATGSLEEFKKALRGLSIESTGALDFSETLGLDVINTDTERMASYISYRSSLNSSISETVAEIQTEIQASTELSAEYQAAEQAIRQYYAALREVAGEQDLIQKQTRVWSEDNHQFEDRTVWASQSGKFAETATALNKLNEEVIRHASLASMENMSVTEQERLLDILSMEEDSVAIAKEKNAAASQRVASAASQEATSIEGLKNSVETYIIDQMDAKEKAEAEAEAHKKAADAARKAAETHRSNAEAFDFAKTAIDDYYAALQKLEKIGDGHVWLEDGQYVTDDAKHYGHLTEKLNDLYRAYQGVMQAHSKEISQSELSVKVRKYEEQAAKENAVAIEELQRKRAATDTKKEVQEANKARKAYDQLLTAIKKVDAELERSSKAATNKNTAATYADLQGIRDTAKAVADAKDPLHMTAGEIENITSLTGEMNTKLKESAVEFEQNNVRTKTLTNRMGGLAQKFGAWLSVSQVIMYAIRTVRKMITAVKEIDAAMTQFQIVTRATNDEMRRFGDSIAQTAKTIGASITDLVDSATTYARLGYTLQESSTLAQYTSMLKAVGDIDVSEAQDAITAITKAFDIDASQIEEVMDKLVTVGNNFPISVAQIAEGMNNASSALHAAGNTFEQSVALLTAANTTVNLCRAA